MPALSYEMFVSRLRLGWCGGICSNCRYQLCVGINELENEKIGLSPVVVSEQVTIPWGY